MIDIKSFNKTFKSTWVKKYLDNDNHSKWKLLFDSESHDFAGFLSLRVTSAKLGFGKVSTSHAYHTPLQQRF